MPVVAEEEEQRIAAELEDVSPVALGNVDQTLENSRNSLDELLGAGLALHRKALSERREAGDVDRDERAVDRPRTRPVLLDAPAPDEPRQVRRQQLVGPCGLFPVDPRCDPHATIMR